MRPIDADKTLQKVDEAFLSFSKHDDILRLYSDTRLVVINAPTISLDDVEPITIEMRPEDVRITLDDLVVHCRDCAVPHNKWTGCPKLNGLVTPPDFYCGFGERKDK